MCGIAGCLLQEPSIDKHQILSQLDNMNSLQRHRGPNDRGTWTDGNVGLAHTRLSILDLSDAGHQPMHHIDASVSLSFNGEIYNFKELRNKLIMLGCSFYSDTDTEVLVNGYKVWGESLFERIQGMFAFSIWDASLKKLYLIRDRFGKKPLYYTIFNKKLIFASEIKSILSWPEVEPNPNYEAIHNYLTYQYVPAPQTAFKNIYKLRPGHVVSIALDSWDISSWAYWSMPKMTEQQASNVDEEELCDSLREHFINAVKSRMISDVPLGAFLSGGVDSSSIVAAMAKISDRPVKTFSIGFDKKDYNETNYARIVSERYSTHHHEEIVQPDAITILPEIIRHYGEPFADPSAIPTFYVSRLAKKHVTVVLSGDGADELLIGYPRYASFTKSFEIDQKKKGIVNNTIRKFLGLYPNKLLGSKGLRVKQHLLMSMPNNKAELYAPYLVYFNDYEKEDGYGDELKPFLYKSSLNLLENYLDEYNLPQLASSWADINTYLPDDILTKVDVASMASSLEVRSPFLDINLVGWCANLPVNYKFDGFQTKRLLKKAMEPWLPNEILYRPKMGFGVPLEHWFRNELKDLLQDTLLSSRFFNRNLFKKPYIEKLIREHLKGSQQHQTRLWSLLIMELWFQMWIDI